ncbi:MAG: FAD-binding domain-containing protein [Litorimonas sp.]
MTSAPPIPGNAPETSRRNALIARARALNPHLADDDVAVSPHQGGRGEALDRLSRIDAIAYGRTRNDTDGAVSRLSPFLRHGVLTMADVRNAVLATVETPETAERFVQQLAWRDYWQRLYAEMGEGVWNDREAYKTGFEAGDYADDLPEDIARAETGVAVIDHFLRELIETGWIHNHARLYLAGYVCHFRRVKWQAGARFFLTHLLDGDPASNNLSWQWAASTFSNKPYYFNLENVQRFVGDGVDTSYGANKVLGGSYEDIHVRLFPNLDPPPPRSGRRSRKSKGGRKRRLHT